MKPVKVALIGSGNISYTYLHTLTKGGFTITEMVGCSDLIPERSKARAETFGIRQMTNEEILSDPEIEIVLNTTGPMDHHDVTKSILEAGKHAYSEKALDRSYEAAKELYDLAASKNLYVGAAPDCYMGSGYQTARKLIDDGWIGTPLFAHAFCYRGYNANERPADHPNFGAAGTTIHYDMSGYYINVLVNLFGSVRRVSGFSRAGAGKMLANPLHPNYRQPAAPGAGSTTSMGILEFEDGCYASLTLTSDGTGPEVPRVEVYGTLGHMTLTDPNNFGGWGDYIYLTRMGNERVKMPFTHGFSDIDPKIPPISDKPWEPCYNSWRGIAVVDMAWAIRRNRLPRSSAELALHAVEVAAAIDRSNAENTTFTITTNPGRPAPLAPGLMGRSAEASIDCI
ncbi:MAG: Gfo/Idh/MocA family oxidoreductase [Firmicutes bacterium]|nr:Gfo/Idh/MocA family oxidoreductase [Bacillota bacterium]